MNNLKFTDFIRHCDEEGLTWHVNTLPIIINKSGHMYNCWFRAIYCGYFYKHGNKWFGVTYQGHVIIDVDPEIVLYELCKSNKNYAMQ